MRRAPGSLAATLALVWVFAATAVAAGPPAEVLRSLGLPGGRDGPEARIERVQTDLAWLGLSKGQIDGRRGPEMRAAIDLFQTSLGAPATGRLDAGQTRLLETRAAAARTARGFRTETFDWVGVRLRLPTSGMRAPELAGEDNTHLSLELSDVPGTRILLERFALDVGPAAWLAELRRYASKSEMRLLVEGSRGAYVYAVGTAAGRRHYLLYEVRQGEVRGIDLSFSEREAVHMRPVVGEILRAFEPHAGPGVPFGSIPGRLARGDDPMGRSRPDWMRRMRGNGSGSIVSARGHVLTNHHVVTGCAALTVNGTPATLAGTDVGLDLALVLAPGMAGRNPARFAARAARLGETVFVMGYPIFRYSPSMNVTDGIVSSTVGFRGDRTRIQITAPVQPGNSGGPVLSRGGNLVAVVVAKFDARAAEINAENVGWVIRAAEAEAFLERMGVRPLRAQDTAVASTIAKRVRDWRRFTVRVECQGT